MGLVHGVTLTEPAASYIVFEAGAFVTTRASASVGKSSREVQQRNSTYAKKVSLSFPRIFRASS